MVCQVLMMHFLDKHADFQRLGVEIASDQGPELMWTQQNRGLVFMAYAPSSASLEYNHSLLWQVLEQQLQYTMRI